jgi:hypothetical protein
MNVQTDAEMARWEKMGYFNSDTDNTLLSCHQSENYGYCHDRGCITHGCWITRSEGGNLAAAKADRYVLNAGETPDDIPRAWQRVTRKWENLKHATPETMSGAIAEMDEAIRRLDAALAGTEGRR